MGAGIGRKPEYEPRSSNIKCGQLTINNQCPSLLGAFYMATGSIEMFRTLILLDFTAQYVLWWATLNGKTSAINHQSYLFKFPAVRWHTSSDLLSRNPPYCAGSCKVSLGLLNWKYRIQLDLGKGNYYLRHPFSVAESLRKSGMPYGALCLWSSHLKRAEVGTVLSY